MVEVNVSQLLSCLGSHVVCFVKTASKAGFVIQYWTQTCMNREVGVFAFASELQGHNPNYKQVGMGTSCAPSKSDVVV